MMKRAEFEAVLDSYYAIEDKISFGGYRYLGYVGNSDRNYITDEWLFRAVRRLKWTKQMLAEFVTNKTGRWTMDSQPMTAKAMFELVRGFEVDVLQSLEKNGGPPPPVKDYAGILGEAMAS